MMRGDPVAQELVIAIFEVRADVGDLESGMLEQLDERRAGVEDQKFCDMRFRSENR
jgi:hypothetical protein